MNDNQITENVTRLQPQITAAQSIEQVAQVLRRNLDAEVDDADVLRICRRLEFTDFDGQVRAANVGFTDIGELYFYADRHQNHGSTLCVSGRQQLIACSMSDVRFAVVERAGLVRQRLDEMARASADMARPRGHFRIHGRHRALRAVPESEFYAVSGRYFRDLRFEPHRRNLINADCGPDGGGRLLCLTARQWQIAIAAIPSLRLDGEPGRMMVASAWAGCVSPEFIAAMDAAASEIGGIR
ncbi:hypothetical protein HUK83_17455 [Endobacter medicaginis]|uniref:Uncharacterized protein n=1 Tax=Endobacter medicaginis TaxID=1181271 RepID=A0A850NRH3_9PROT|nr:hypothetical protein [Endobacter medicaginis]MCX5477314.1 hypothetical protein [Endobacter medicaginis]NVN32113.1 hypothetical protein [Endobacter medicaginis]